MNWSSRHTVVLCSAALLAGAGLWVGCGGDDTTTPPVDAGIDKTNTPDTGTQDTGTQDTGTQDTGTQDSGGDGATNLPQTCAQYCTLVQATCTANNGQYIDQQTCEAMCAKFPGADAGAGDGGVTSGPSLACRIYHATVAAQNANNAAIHCPHAGPYGFGGCASEVENFCILRAAQCTGNGGYGGNCGQAFGQIVDTTDGGTFLTGTGPRDCREYHLQNAYKGNVTSGSHCDHASQSGGGVCP